MRRFLSAVLAAALLALVGASAMGAPREIVVYSPFPDEQIQDLARPFTAKTGIRVTNMVISSGEILARIKAERNNPQADFWLSVRALYLKEAVESTPPLIERYKPANLEGVAEAYKFPGSDYLVGVGMYPLVFFYNTTAMKNLKLEPPKNWADLLDPKWKDRIVMPHPATSGTAYSAITTILEMSKTEDEGWDFVAKLSRNISQFTRSGRAPQNLVARGEYPLGIGFFDAVYQLRDEGYPIEFVFPSPIYADPWCAAVVAGAKNPEGAKAFYDYLLTKEAQQILTKYGNYSVRVDVPAPKGGIPLSQMNVLDSDWIWASVHKNRILDKFQAVTQAEPK